MNSAPSPPDLEIRSLAPGGDSTPFRILNEEWIRRFFVLEAHDREVLNDPDTHILARGGHVFLAFLDAAAIACVALIPTGNGVYELSKMAVAPGLRGLGIGRRLLEYTIQEARRIGAQSLFLGSSTKLPNAIHLYESLGFRHVPAHRLPDLPYVRADVFMELTL